MKDEHVTWLHNIASLQTMNGFHNEAKRTRAAADYIEELEQNYNNQLIVSQDWAERNVELESRQAVPPCETCRETGWYGDKVAGITGNNEYHRCGCPAGTSRSMDVADRRIRKLERQLETSKASLVIACRFPAVPQEIVELVEASIMILDAALGDTDPHIEDDWTVDDIRDAHPLFWLCQKMIVLAAAIAKAEGNERKDER